MDDTFTQAICRRIAQVRTETAGPRGKSAFAKSIGLSPSTYEYYESSRVPPADVLLAIASAASVDIRWLLTGEPASASIPPDHPILQRAAKLLADTPHAAAPLAAFLDLLAKSLAFPAKQPAPTPASPADSSASSSVAAASLAPSPSAISASSAVNPSSSPSPSPDDRDGWLPILGRSAAGIAQFWADSSEAAGLTHLSDLVGRHAHRQHRLPATAWASDAPENAPVWIVTLQAPDESDTAEFLAAPHLKARFPDAFALRIDGDSMSPDIRHGDLVVLSPSAPALDGRPAVVQLAGQIGVTCKLFRPAGRQVHLIPVNDRFEPQSFPASKVSWAFRVLARVRV